MPFHYHNRCQVLCRGSERAQIGFRESAHSENCCVIHKVTSRAATDVKNHNFTVTESQSIKMFTRSQLRL